MEHSETRTIAAWQQAIGAWLTTTGMDKVTTHAHLRHLQEEIEEYYEEISALISGQRSGLDRAGYELADMMFILLGQAHLQGINLEQAMQEKFALNKLRTPLPMGPDGLVRLSKPTKEQT